MPQLTLKECVGCILKKFLGLPTNISHKILNFLFKAF